MQKIYSEEESDARLHFTTFFHDIFRIQRKHTTTFKYPLSTELLFTMYVRLFPETMLSQADLEHYFITLGVTDTNNILLELRPEATIPQELLDGLTAHMIPRKAATLQMSKIPAKLSTELAVNSFEHFVDGFVKTVRKDIRTPVRNLFELYILFCSAYKLTPLTRKRALNILRERVGKVYRGYAGGISGVNYILGEIPNKEDWERSIRLGIGVFNYLNQLFDNRGKRIRLTEDNTPVDNEMALYITQRTEGRKYAYVTRQDEPQAAEGGSQEEQKETSADIDGRETQSVDEDVSRGTSQSDTETNNNADEAGGTSDEKPKITRSRVTKDARSDATEDSNQHLTKDSDGTVERRVARSADDEVTRTTTIKSEPVRHREEVQAIIEPTELEDPIVEDDEEFEERPATKKEIFAALEIAYRINPVTFNQKEMNSYLVSMDVDYAAADLWDEFMQFVGGKKL